MWDRSCDTFQLALQQTALSWQHATYKYVSSFCTYFSSSIHMKSFCLFFAKNYSLIDPWAALKKVPGVPLCLCCRLCFQKGLLGDICVLAQHAGFVKTHLLGLNFVEMFLLASLDIFRSYRLLGSIYRCVLDKMSMIRQLGNLNIINLCTSPWFLRLKKLPTNQVMTVSPKNSKTS